MKENNDEVPPLPVDTGINGKAANYKRTIVDELKKAEYEIRLARLDDLNNQLNQIDKILGYEIYTIVDIIKEKPYCQCIVGQNLIGGCRVFEFPLNVKLQENDLFLLTKCKSVIYRNVKIAVDIKRLIFDENKNLSFD